MNFLDSLRKLDVWIVLFGSALLSTVIVFSVDLSPLHRAVLYAGLIGIAVFLTLPNKRILLVVAWVLLHPLSLEKVFIVGKPLLPEFFPPRIVLSGSDLIFMMLLLYLAFESFFEREEKVWFVSSPLIPLLFFSFWAILSFYIHRISTDTTLALLHILKMLLFLLVFSSAIRTRNELILVLLSAAIALGIQALLVVVSHFSSVVFHFSSKVSSQLMTFGGTAGQTHVRATGTVGHVNQEACFLTFFVFPLFGLLGLKNRWSRLFIVAIITFTFLAIVLTFSRSAWLSSIIGVGIILLMAFKKRITENRIWLYIFPVIMVGCIFILVFHQSIIDRIVHGDEGATASRKRAAVLSLDLFRQHPFLGVGIGNFVGASLEKYPPKVIKNLWLKPGQQPRPLAYRYGRLEVNQIKIGNRWYIVPLPVHNKYLLVLSELGIVGLSLFLWFLYCLYRLAVRCFRTSDSVLLLSAIGFMAGLWAIFCYMNLDLFADDKTVEILLFVPVVIISLSRIVNNTSLKVTTE